MYVTSNKTESGMDFDIYSAQGGTLLKHFTVTNEVLENNPPQTPVNLVKSYFQEVNPSISNSEIEELLIDMFMR